MSYLDTLEGAAMGMMTGDQNADQEMLQQLQSMTSALGMTVQAAETARQIPIATTLGLFNIAQFQHLTEGVTPLRQADTERVNLLNEQIEMGMESKRNIAEMANISTRIAREMMEEGKTQEALKATQNAKTYTEMLDAQSSRINALYNKRKSEARLPAAGRIGRTETIREISESEAAAAAADVATQGSEILTQLPEERPEVLTPAQQMGLDTARRTELDNERLQQMTTNLVSQGKLTDAQASSVNTQVQRIMQDISVMQPVYDDFEKLYPTDPDGALQLISDKSSALQGKYPNYYGIIAGIADRAVNATTQEGRDQAMRELRMVKGTDNQQIAMFEYMAGRGDIDPFSPEYARMYPEAVRDASSQAFYTGQSWGWYDQDMQGRWIPYNRTVGIKPDQVHARGIDLAEDTLRHIGIRPDLSNIEKYALRKVDRDFGKVLAAGIASEAGKLAKSNMPAWIQDDNERTLYNIINQPNQIRGVLQPDPDTPAPAVVVAMGMLRRAIGDQAYKAARIGLAKTLGDQFAVPDPVTVKTLGVTPPGVGLDIDDEVKRRLGLSDRPRRRASGPVGRRMERIQ